MRVENGTIIRAEILKRATLLMMKSKNLCGTCVTMLEIKSVQILSKPLPFSAPNPKVSYLLNFTVPGPTYQHVCRTDLSKVVTMSVVEDLILKITEASGLKKKSTFCWSLWHNMAPFGKKLRKNWRFKEKETRELQAISKTNISNWARQVPLKERWGLGLYKRA